MKRLNYRRIIQHTGFWSSFILLFVVIYGPVFNNFPWLFLSSLVMLPFTMLVVYFINYALLPGFLKRKKYISLGIIVLLILILEPPIPRILVMILSGEELTFKNFLDYNLLPFYFETGLITFIAFSIKLFKESIREREEKNQMEKQKLQAELTALRSQLNAHFLFNTLNNLYGLALQKSDRTPRGILMLSEMLHFVLYECSTETYKLNKELDFINNYIELEKLRYGKRLKINLELDIGEDETQIAPLLLFPFVENSFKHGASKKINDAWISIRVRTRKDEILFDVKNNKTRAHTSDPDFGGGVGLENVRKRLDILYPHQHRLAINEDETTFSISLNIHTKPKR